MRGLLKRYRKPTRPADDGSSQRQEAGRIAAGRPDRPALYLGRRGGEPVEFSGEGSLLTVGPPGTGKSRGVAVWNLLSYPGSMLVTDPKGELAGWSAEYRAEKLGQSVAVLDPFGVTGFPPASINPLAGLLEAVARGSGLRSEAERVAHMLLPDMAGERDPFWRQGGRRLLATGLLYLAVLEQEHCHLPGLYDVLWQGNEAFADKVLGSMREAGGPFRTALWQYAEDTSSTMIAQERAFAVFREEARQALSIFAGDEPCGQACLSSSLDFSALVEGGLTVYLVLPAEFVTSHGRWMGLVTSHAIHAIMRSRRAGDCVFMLDEFPNLGPLPGIRDAVAQLRGKGLRVWMFVQDIAQLEAIYGKADALNLRAQAEVLQVLGCRSVELAEFIEKRAGQKTVKVMTVGLPDPADPLAGPRPNIAETGVPVLPVSTVLEMPAGKQVLIRHGYPVALADVVLWDGE